MRDGELREAPETAQAAPDRVTHERGPEHHGNFVVGCLVGSAVASLVWAVIGYAMYRLL